ncbi:hypothetical protein MHYP_G00031870 [Metynnis hypsauchen]
MTVFCLICLVPLLQPLVATASDCSTVRHANGSVTCSLSDHVSYCPIYNWLINGIVQANEDTFNSTLIESRGPRYSTFYSCQQISYRNICTGEIIDCFSPCPTDFTTVSQPKGYSAPDCVNLAAVVGGSVCGVIALCVFVLVWWNRKLLKRYFQASRTAGCRCDYRATPQDAEQHNQMLQC